MTQTDILRAFLIKLGFKIDATGKQKFVDTVASMTVNAVKLGTAITAASASVTAGVAKSRADWNRCTLPHNAPAHRLRIFRHSALPQLRWAAQRKARGHHWSTLRA